MMKHLFTWMDHVQRATHASTSIINGIKEGTFLGHEEMCPRCSMFPLVQQGCFEILQQQFSSK